MVIQGFTGLYRGPHGCIGLNRVVYEVYMVV